MNEKKRYIKKLALCAGYAVFATICLYKAPHGITYPVFAAATVAGLYVVMQLLGEKVKRTSIGFVAGIAALSVHVCTTGSEKLIVMDKFLLLVLFAMLVLHNLYDDRRWDVTRYVSAIIKMLTSSVSFLLAFVTDGLSLRERTAKTLPTAENATSPAPAPNLVSGSDLTEVPAEPIFFEAAPGAAVSANPSPSDGIARNVLLGLFISIPLLAIVLPLLAFSDAVFGDALNDVLNLQFDEDIFYVGLMVIGIFVASYAVIARAAKPMESLQTPPADARTKSPVTAITFTTVLLLVYLVYCGIQVFYLFLGEGQLPAGYTYAEYAHEGFYELVFVCLFNLVLVLLCRRNRRNHIVLQVVLTAVCACTYVMLASSLYRMILYISAYGFTYLRAFVLWGLAAIALVMAATVALVWRDTFPFVRCALAATVLCWVVFAFSYPDRWIARYNLTHGCDVDYVLNDLSSDATPVIVEIADSLEPDYGAWKTASQAGRPYRHYVKKMETECSAGDFRNFNFSEYRARKAVEEALARE